MSLRRFGLPVFLLLAILSVSVHADAKQEIADKLCDVVSVFKYVAGAIAIGAITYVGAEHLTAGNNPMKREELKGKLFMIVLGMLLVLFSHYIVGVFLPSAASCPVI